jgi:hypothetical protein
MLADELDFVVGVDTHRDQHVLSVVAAPTGAVVAQRSVAASGHGYAQALRFANEHAHGARVWAIEGAGHYGCGLARYLNGRCETVLEAGRSPRGERRLPSRQAEQAASIRRRATNLDGRSLTVKQMEVETLAAEIQTGVQHELGPPLDSSQSTSWSVSPGEALLHGIPYHGTTQASGRNRRQRFCLVSGVFALVRFATGCARWALSEEGPRVK